MTFHSLVVRTVVSSCIVVSSAAAYAQAPTAKDLVGTWKLTITSPQGSHPGTLVLSEDGGKVVGNLDGEMGKLPVSVTTSEKGVTIAFTVDYQGPLAVVLTGTVAGDTMKGLVDYGGGMAAGDFEGTRGGAAATSAGASVTGTWAITADAGSGWELTLTQDGPSVTGQLTNAADGILCDVRGTLEGTVLTLQVSGQANGAMKGAIENGALSGSYDIEGSSGRWSATRKS